MLSRPNFTAAIRARLRAAEVVGASFNRRPSH
jgi:hypothetical protein